MHGKDSCGAGAGGSVALIVQYTALRAPAGGGRNTYTDARLINTRINCRCFPSVSLGVTSIWP